MTAEATQRNAQPPQTILLVDDDAILRGILEFSLQRLGFCVLAAGSGAAALDIAARQPGISLLITDVTMPGMGGSELARRLRETHPDAASLFISGVSWDATTKREPVIAQSRFLQKPFTPAQLEERIRAMLAPA